MDHTLSSATAEYNRIAASLDMKTVKSFKDKPTALRRLAEIQEMDKPVKSNRGRKGDGFNFGAEHTHTGELFHKVPRASSVRASALTLMKRKEGASFDEIMELVDANDRGPKETLRYRTARVIRAINFSLGWELIQEPNVTGNIKAR